MRKFLTLCCLLLSLVLLTLSVYYMLNNFSDIGRKIYILICIFEAILFISLVILNKFHKK